MEMVEHSKGMAVVHAEGHGHSMSKERHNYLLKFGWWVYIASEIMLFSSLIGTFLLAKKLYPEGQEHLNVSLTAFNTFLLLMSSWTVVRALASLHEGDQVGLQRSLFLSFILGSIFVGIQVY